MREDKRAFFGRLIAGLGVGATTAATLASPARAQNAGGWKATAEPQDAWIDQLGARHRQVFDTITPEGVGRALTFCRTFYVSNKDGYGIEAKDLGVVMIFRAGSTPFGYNAKFWAKYSAPLFERTKMADPATKAAPLINLYDTPDTKPLSLTTLAGMGVHFAICQVSSKGLAEAIATASGTTADAVFADMQANFVSNARLMASGITAVNRTQEHGFSLCYTA